MASSSLADGAELVVLTVGGRAILSFDILSIPAAKGSEAMFTCARSGDQGEQLRGY